jgi:RNA polymerase sigma factor (TIGR02999 family)
MRQLSLRRTPRGNFGPRLVTLTPEFNTLALRFTMTDVTQLLAAIERGDPPSASQLLPLVYDELRRLASEKLLNEAPGQTLQPTALVHEAYLRLVGSNEGVAWDSRGHFFAAAAEAMQRILVENARRRRSLKRGGDRKRLDIDEVQPAVFGPDDDVLALDAALTKLATKYSVKAELVKLRFYGGCTGEQAARLLGISTATADRYWTYARAWLQREISGELNSDK